MSHCVVLEKVETRVSRVHQEEFTVYCRVVGYPNIMIMWDPLVVRNMTVNNSQLSFAYETSSTVAVSTSTCFTQVSQINCIATITDDNTVIAAVSESFTLCGECYLGGGGGGGGGAVVPFCNFLC